MDQALRSQKLKEIMENGTPYMTGIRIRYRGKPETFSAYQIPLEFLIYNKYNGRIGSAVKSFEKEQRDLNPENEDDKKIIENFLWESNKDRNKFTMSDLMKNTQREYGIVSANGMIVDGNRRAYLLNRIYSERERYAREGNNVDHCQYFTAVILPQDADKKEIMKLETTYQMGEDKKLDYNAIEKYLKCKDLKGEGFSPKDISDMMNEPKGKVDEWLETMKLMDEYLDYLGYSGIYTRLEKTEDLFLNLNKALKKYEKGKGLRWSCDELDLNDFKSVAFYYIRIRYEGKQFRDLVGAKNNGGIFSTSPEVWNDFLVKHKQIIDKHKEKDPQQLREEHPTADITKILEKRDEDFTKVAESELVHNLEDSVFKVDAINKKDKPLELATKAIDLLESINQQEKRFFSADVLDLLKRINTITSEMIEQIEQQEEVGQ